jgi:hypothetical protein
VSGAGRRGMVNCEKKPTRPAPESTQVKRDSSVTMPKSQGSVSDSDSSHTPPGDDVVIVHDVTDDGKGLKVLRARAGELETGAVRPLEEGKPILGEVVRLRPRQACPLVCDVEVDLPKPAPGAAAQASRQGEPAESRRRGKGPAQVSSDAYRQNWDAIFAQPKKAALPN